MDRSESHDRTSTHMNAIYAVGKLPLKFNILRGEFIIHILFIDILHLANELVLVVFIVAVVVESSSDIAVALLASLPSFGGLRVLVSESRETNGTRGVERAQVGEIQLP